MRTEWSGSQATLRIVIPHPMQTGRHAGDDGVVVPAHFIEEITCEHVGRVVLRARWGSGIARNPSLGLRLRRAAPGDEIRIAWVDNLGGRDVLVTRLE
ncbi:MAG: thiosulfate oxidation carrier complex protein SoxZ [Gammaproteobacteria bacterium]